jgi:hypothetical protein
MPQACWQCLTSLAQDIDPGLQPASVAARPIPNIISAADMLPVGLA